MTALRGDLPLAYRRLAVDAEPRRLLVLAHGVGGTEHDLSHMGAAAPPDTAVILARGPLTIGPSQYAWFPVSFSPQGPQPDHSGAEASRVLLGEFIASLQARENIAPRSTVIAGFSQGGIISASVGLTRPDCVAGFGVLAGRILPELAPRIASPSALARTRGFIGHGLDDTKLPVQWAHRADAWLTDLGVQHRTVLYPGGHTLPPAMQSDFLGWFDAVTAY